MSGTDGYLRASRDWDKAKARYAVIATKGAGGGAVKRLNFRDPVDALCAAIEYLRKGYHVRLNDPLCDALSETDHDMAQMVRRVAAALSLSGGGGRPYRPARQYLPALPEAHRGGQGRDLGRPQARRPAPVVLRRQQRPARPVIQRQPRRPPPPRGATIMSRVHDAILDCLTAELATRTEWDEPPALYLIILDGGVPHLDKFPLLDSAWELGRPPEVLAALARAWEHSADVIRPEVPPGLHGAAFRTEAWRVALPVGDPETGAVIRASEEHRLSEHPLRVEERDVFAVDRAGATFMVTWARGEAEPLRKVAHRRPGSDEGMLGAIPNALDRIVTALLGVPLPARPDV
jgi:hypothetical protein